MLADSDDERTFKMFVLELTPEEGIVNEKQLVVDEVTWRTFFRSALLKLHGVFGTAIEVEVLETKANRALVRLQSEDLAKFKSAIVVYTADLSICGLEGQVGTIRLTESSSALLS